jgi:hypothetical protein
MSLRCKENLTHIYKDKLSKRIKWFVKLITAK